MKKGNQDKTHSLQTNLHKNKGTKTLTILLSFHTTSSCSKEWHRCVVCLLACGSSELNCSSHSSSGCRHHRSISAVVCAALSPALLPHLPEWEHTHPHTHAPTHTLPTAWVWTNVSQYQGVIKSIICVCMCVCSVEQTQHLWVHSAATPPSGWQKLQEGYRFHEWGPVTWNHQGNDSSIGWYVGCTHTHTHR